MIESNSTVNKNYVNVEDALADSDDVELKDDDELGEDEFIEEIVVPEGIVGGETMEIKVRGGRRMSFTFPSGVEAGQLLHIVIPGDDE